MKKVVNCHFIKKKGPKMNLLNFIILIQYTLNMYDNNVNKCVQLIVRGIGRPRKI